MIRSLRRAALLGGLFCVAPLLAAVAPASSGSTAALVSDPAESPAATDTATDTAPALIRALQAIQPDRISADLHFLASDAMGGRDTPSKELDVAAHFLRARLQRLEFTPGAGESYFYEYPLNSTALDPEASTASFASGAGETKLQLTEDYWIGAWRVSEATDLAGAAVSIGEGEHDDLEAAELEGKWALMLDRGGNKTRRKVREVAQRGGLGLIVAQSADYEHDETLEQRFGGDRYEALLRGKVDFPRSEEERTARPTTPTVFLTRDATERLLAQCAGYDGDAKWFPKAGAETGVRFHERRALASEGGRVMVKNVCGLWPGSDPELSKEVILVSAHYDHVGRQGGEIHNGADDNGSGTSGLLSVAEALHAYGPLKRSVLLIWVSGEEKGLWGSKAWANDPSLPEGYRAVANLNMDMIGRNASDELFITPTREHKHYNVITEVAMKLSPLEGFPKLDSADEYYHRSDQAEFARLGIPVAFLFAGIHEDYHQPSDTPDKIDYDKLSRVSRLIVRLLDEIQDMPLTR